MTRASPRKNKLPKDFNGVLIVVAVITEKFISRINSKHLAPHFGAELFLVAILFFGIHFFSKMAVDG